QLDAAIVADRGADDDEPAHDGGRRSDLIAAAVVADADALAEIDLSVTSEAWAGCPGRGVERDEPRVDGCDEDAPTTGATRTRVGIEPGGPPGRGDDGETALGIEVRVVAPALGPRLGVEGDDAVVRCAEKQCVVHHERRGLEGDEAPGSGAAA